MGYFQELNNRDAHYTMEYFYFVSLNQNIGYLTPQLLKPVQFNLLSGFKGWFR